MADAPALALQLALIAALRASPAAALVDGRIYDEPPDEVARPYIRLGDINPAPHRTSTATHWAVSFSVEIHSQPAKAGRVEANRIAGEVVAALDDADLPVAGYRDAWCEFVTQATTRAADGKSYTAVAAFETLLEGL